MAKRKDYSPGDVLNGNELIADLGRISAFRGERGTRQFGIFKCSYCCNFMKTSIKVALRTPMLSCGCLRIKHGKSRSRIYKLWYDILARCCNVKNTSYDKYGGRGITICDEWVNSFESFYEWAMNNGYTDELTIDREDNYKGYDPNNCRWVSRFVNNQNQRLLRKNNTSGYRGVHKLKKIDRYSSVICYNGASYYLGLFKTAKDAAIAYNNFVITNKTFHPLNIIV